MNTSAPPSGGMIDPAALPALFAPRGPDTHKGSFGTVGVVGGGPGMTGAALLAARAALKTGAGKVLVGFAQEAAPLACDPLQPELMLRDARSLLEADLGVTAWVAGCGIGTGLLAANILSELFVLRREAPLVLDADALNLLARGEIQPGWGAGPVVLTPHPAEAARLLGAGTGDVLAGMLGALLAQQLPLEQAVAGAVWLHGAAADALVAAGIGPIGLTAGELADAARRLRNGGR